MTIQERYTHGHHESVVRTHSWRTVENSAGYLVPHLDPGLSLLDVGSGPGTITIDFAERLAPGRVVGVDAAPDVVEQAREKAAAGIDNVEFYAGDAYNLDFPDNEFDVVHAHQTLQHLGDPIAALREMARVAKPGGLIAARDVIYGSASWYPLLPGLEKWMRVYQGVARANGGEPDAGRSLKSWVLEAGLEVVDSSASIWCFADDEQREWWGGAWAVRARESSFGPQSLEVGAATPDDLDEISQAWLEWVAASNGWFAMPHGEIVARVPR